MVWEGWGRKASPYPDLLSAGRCWRWLVLPGRVSPAVNQKPRRGPAETSYRRIWAAPLRLQREECDPRKEQSRASEGRLETDRRESERSPILIAIGRPHRETSTAPDRLRQCRQWDRPVGGMSLQFLVPPNQGFETVLVNRGVRALDVSPPRRLCRPCALPTARSD